MKSTPRSTQIKLVSSILALGIFFSASVITLPLLYRSTENRSAAIGINLSPAIPSDPSICDPNGDGRTDGLDYSLIYSHYGSADPYATGDCTGDGAINGLDLIKLYEDWQPN